MERVSASEKKPRVPSCSMPSLVFHQLNHYSQVDALYLLVP